MSRFPFPAYPEGWFQVAYAADVAPGALVPLSYFGRQLVAFRTGAGAVSVLDAFCPHLGAHLGVGGRVIGDTLRCPFHGWRFDTRGRCTLVPYATKIPPAAHARAWDTRERNGMIWVHHPSGHPHGHADSAPAAWEVPDLAELGSPDWTPLEHRRWTIRTRPQEIFENTVDGPHLHFVHGLLTVPRTQVQADGHRLHTRHQYKMQTPRGPVDMTLEATAHGLGLQVVRITGFARVLILMTPTPCDDEQLELRLSFSVHTGGGADAARALGEMLSASIERELEEDIPIWENKAYLTRPALCDGDAPIGRFRRWARQFYNRAYSEAPEAPGAPEAPEAEDTP